MKIWLVTVTREEAGTSWVDTVFETYRQARRRADDINRLSPGMHAVTEPRVVIPAATPPLREQGQ